MKGGTVVMENTTEKKSIGRFSILDEETFDAAENSEYWATINREKLKTRKYYPETFSDKFSKIYYWAGHNLDKLEGLTLEEQEEIFIKEGLLTREDI